MMSSVLMQGTLPLRPALGSSIHTANTEPAFALFINTLVLLRVKNTTDVSRKTSSDQQTHIIVMKIDVIKRREVKSL